MTSLLLSASHSAQAECERMQTFGWELTAGISIRLSFLPFFFFFFKTHKLNLPRGVIWIGRSDSKDLFAVLTQTANWTHMKNKGTKQKSKKKGSDNAFSCDLIEHLQSSGQDGKCVNLFYFNKCICLLYLRYNNHLSCFHQTTISKTVT